MRCKMCIFVLILQVCYLESSSSYRPMRRTRFKDAFLDARKAGFIETLLGRARRSASRNDHIRRQTDTQKFLEDLEVMVYAKRLSLLLRKRSCTEWWCMSDKATEKTVPTTTMPPEPPPISSKATVRTELPPMTTKVATTTAKGSHVETTPTALTSMKTQPTESQSTTSTKTTMNNTLVSVVVTLTTPGSAAAANRVSVLKSICWLPVMILPFH